MNTLIVPFLASNVNVGASLHAVGLPSANAITGFAHAALRLIKDMTGSSPSDQGASLIINKYTLTPGRQKPQNAEHGDKDNVKASKFDASLSDERLAIIDGWVVIRFGVRLSGLTMIQDKLSDIAEQMHGLSFSGGTLSIPGKLQLIENDDSGSEALARLPSNARVVVDQTQDLERYATAYGLDYFEAMIRLLVISEEQGQQFFRKRSGENSDADTQENEAEATAIPTDEPKTSPAKAVALPMDQHHVEERSVFESSYLGHLVPIDIGYRAIEEPQARNARGTYLHIFAEPVTGIARIQLLSSLIRRKESEKAFWQHSNNHPMYLSKGAV